MKRTPSRGLLWLLGAVLLGTVLGVSVVTLPLFTLPQEATGDSAADGAGQPAPEAPSGPLIAEEAVDEAVPHAASEVLSPISGEPGARSGTPGDSVVSITFDDGTHDQIGAVNILSERGLTGTFYVISGYVGRDGFLSREDVAGIAERGHEIGGHTVDHRDLAEVSAVEATRSICIDRETLLSWGHAVRSFAYPFASSTEAVEAAAEACGYSSARGLGDLYNPHGCTACQNAEFLEPDNPFRTKAASMYIAGESVQDLKDIVLRGRDQGEGWTQLTFHGFCEDDEAECSAISVRRSVFTEFADWLAGEVDAGETSVRTVGDVIGGEVLPAVSVESRAPAPRGEDALADTPLSILEGQTAPVCWSLFEYGENESSVTFSRIGDGDEVEATIAVSSYTSGDVKLLVDLDQGECAPSIEPGRSYLLSAEYRSDVPTQFVVYARTREGAWEFLTASEWLSAEASFTRVSWTTPAIPERYTALSFGLSIFSSGWLTTSGYELRDAGGAARGM